MGEQGVDQGAVFVAGRRMHDQAGGLVEHEQVGVLVEDGEGDRLAARGMAGAGAGGARR